jgi:hypothetical protein
LSHTPIAAPWGRIVCGVEALSIDFTDDREGGLFVAAVHRNAPANGPFAKHGETQTSQNSLE